MNVMTKARILRESASALAYIHTKGILHRDVKPDNILLTDTLTAKLMDFGISTIVRDNRDAQVMTTRVGTAFYMVRDR